MFFTITYTILLLVSVLYVLVAPILLYQWFRLGGTWKSADKHGLFGIAVVFFIAVLNAGYSMSTPRAPAADKYWREFLGAGVASGWSLGYFGMFWVGQILLSGFFSSRYWRARIRRPQRGLSSKRIPVWEWWVLYGMILFLLIILVFSFW
jgi:hypothetical protein